MAVLAEQAEQRTLVSVYMPTRDRLASLKAAVQSVLNQSYPDIELLVVDDASGDGTPAYLQELAAREPRVRIFLNDQSRGACYCRNLAINSASGEFVTGLDDDDEFLPSRIETFVAYWRFLEAHDEEPFSCLYSNVISKRSGGTVAVRKAGRVAHKDLFGGNLLGNQVFAPRRYYLEAGGFDEQMPAWQDLEFFYRLIGKFGKARLVDLHTYLFDERERPDRISVGRKERIMEAYSRMASKHARNPRERQQLLMLVYAGFYGFRITLQDLANFMKLGFWPDGYRRMLGRYVLRLYRRPGL